MAQSRASGYCVSHDHGAQYACRKDCHANSRSERVGELQRAPRGPSVIASLASALERTLAFGELEERLRGLEDFGTRARVGKASP